MTDEPLNPGEVSPEERPVWRVITTLLERGQQAPYGTRDKHIYRCPAHEDRSPSLTVAEGRDGRALVHCFAGCTVQEICDALGLSVRDLFVRREPDPVGPRFTQARGMLASYLVRYPELGWLIEQVLEDRLFYLDGGPREQKVREQYPHVPTWLWGVLKK